MEEVIKDLSQRFGITPKDVLDVYKSYWKFIKAKIESLPLKEDLDDDSFNKLKTNFNIPKLGKINCTLHRYKVMKSIIKGKENDKY